MNVRVRTCTYVLYYIIYYYIINKKYIKEEGIREVKEMRFISFPACARTPTLYNI
nr:MAG TPA: hypothetical protein [Herelleviridae sp.]